MLLPGLILSTVFISSTQASWYNDIISPNGWHFGDGMVFHIEDTKAENSSFLDRIALRVDYGEVEVSAVPKPEKEAVQLNFFMKDQQQERSSSGGGGGGGSGKKTMGNIMIPFWLGAAKGTAVTMLLAGMKIMALKSLLLAKVAVIISAAILAVKYFKNHEPYYVEVEQTAGSEHAPVYEFPGASNLADHQAVYAYSPYHAYAPSGAEATAHYATVVNAAAGENETAAAKKLLVSAAVKRKDQAKRRITPTATVLTIKHYKPEGLI